MNTHAQITKQSVFEMAVNGTFYDQAKPKASQWGTPVAFPVRNNAGRSLQLHLTDYSINTLLEADYSNQGTLNVSKLLKQVLKVDVNTTSIGKVIPQLITKYGKNVELTISGVVKDKKSNAKFTTGRAQADFSLAISGVIDTGSKTETAFYGEFDGAAVDSYLKSSKAGVLSGSIPTLSIGKINPKTFRTTLGISAMSL